jgi:hypothetical protein
MTDVDTSKPAWWVSWYSPASLGGFELHWPWWRAGWEIEGYDQELTKLAALVRADTEDEAFAIIEESYHEKPEKGVERRFANIIKDGDKLPWQHEGSRFPLEDWMTWEV